MKEKVGLKPSFIICLLIFSLIKGDQCPMHFDDGANPWMQAENHIKIFRYGSSATTNVLTKGATLLLIALALLR
jgi:hypothetical protein